MGVSTSGAGKSAPQAASMVVLGTHPSQSKEPSASRRSSLPVAGTQESSEKPALLTGRSTPTLDHALPSLPLRSAAVERGLALRYAARFPRSLCGA